MSEPTITDINKHEYLKQRLTNGSAYSRLRENSFKNEYIIKYDELYNILFIVYWIIFCIYVGLAAYKNELTLITFITIIVMIAFPFFINSLTYFCKSFVEEIFEFFNNFSLIDPRIDKSIREVGTATADSLRSIKKKLEKDDESLNKTGFDKQDTKNIKDSGKDLMNKIRIKMLEADDGDNADGGFKEAKKDALNEMLEEL